MKKLFKKSMAVLLSATLLISGMSISSFATEVDDGVIDTEAEFIAAIKAGENIELGGDIELTQSISVPADSSIVITGNSHAITTVSYNEFNFENFEAWSSIVFNLEDGADLTVKNLTFKDFANAGINTIFYIGSNASDAKLTLESVTFDNSNETAKDDYHYCIEAWAGNIVTKDCDFNLVPGDGTSSNKSYLRGILLFGSAYATVSGCDFYGDADSSYITEAIACDASSSAVKDDDGNYIYLAEGFVVSDCTFTDCNYGITVTGNAPDNTTQLVENSTFTNSDLKVMCIWSDWYACLRIEDSITLEGTSSIVADSDYAEIIIGRGTYGFNPNDYTVEDTNLVSDNGDGTYTVSRNEELYLDIIEELMGTTPLVIDEETANTSENVNDMLVELVEALILENTDYDGDILVQSIVISTTNFVAAKDGVDGSFDYNVAVGLGTDVVAIRNIDGMGVINAIVDTTTTTTSTTVTTENTASVAVVLDEESAQSVFTAKELASGDELKVELSISEVTEFTEDEQTAIDELVLTLEKTYEVALILDIDLTKYVGDEFTSLTELSEEITITIDIPEELQGKDLVIIRVHENEDGTITTDILHDIDDDDATFTFKTDKFSTYALAESAEVDNTTTNDDSVVVQTDDTNSYFLVVAVMIISCLGVVFTSRKNGAANSFRA